MAFGWYLLFVFTTLVVVFNILLKIVSKYSSSALYRSRCVFCLAMAQPLSPWLVFTLIAVTVAVVVVVVAATVAGEVAVDVAADRLHLAVCEISCGHCDFLPY